MLEDQHFLASVIYISTTIFRAIPASIRAGTRAQNAHLSPVFFIQAGLSVLTVGMFRARNLL
jgi:hypothetical protein